MESLGILLPGRTDNEIKNYWNTRMKRRLRAGLPIYPPEIQALENHQPDQKGQCNSSSASLSFLLSSPWNQNATQYSPFSISINQFKPSHESIGGLALSLSSSVSPFSFPSIPLTWLNQGLQTKFSPNPSLQFNYLTFNNDPRASTGVLLNSSNLLSRSEIESLPIQSPAHASALISSGSSGNSSEYKVATFGEVDDISPEYSFVRTGLLQDLEESRALTLAEKSRKKKMVEDVKGKEKCESENQLLENIDAIDELLEDVTPAVLGESFCGIDYGHTTDDNNWEDIRSANSSNAKLPILEDINSLESDLFSFLDYFTSSVAVPDWDDSSFNSSSVQPPNTSNSNGEVNNGEETSFCLTVNDGNTCWNNEPSDTKN